MTDATLKELDLTCPEKAIIISALSFFRSGGRPTMSNIEGYSIEGIKKVLEYPGVKGLLILVCDNERKKVLDLFEKIGVQIDDL